MADFNYVDCTASNATPDSIRSVVTYNGGILSSFGYGYACPTGVTPEVPGWDVSLVDKRGMGNHGSYIAVATRGDTFHHQYEATMRMLRRMVDEEQPDSDTGDIGCFILPLLYSPLLEWRGLCFGRSGPYRFYGMSHANYLRVGDGRHRIWVKRAKPLPPKSTGLGDLIVAARSK